MKTLMMTTAVCLTMTASAFADTPMTEFMDYSITSNDLLASELIGMRVYSAKGNVDVTANMSPGAQTEWDDIGEVNEIVVSREGDVIAMIVGVGGFLGVGEKDVALDMKQIHVMREADDADNFFLVVNSSSDALNAAPGFARNMERAEKGSAAAAAVPERPLLMAPAVEREGYVRTERTQLTAEMLTGARVYGANNEDVGEINSLLLDDNGAMDRVVIDVGGFLGMGEKPVAVTFDELTILHKDGGDLQVFIDSSTDALKAQPTYEE